MKILGGTMIFKAVFWLATLAFSFTYASTNEFKSLAIRKVRLAQAYAKAHRYISSHCFFESGTYIGQTTINAAQLFNKVITVEVYRPFSIKTNQSFFLFQYTQLLCNSAEVIANVGNRLKELSFFG